MLLSSSKKKERERARDKAKTVRRRTRIVFVLYTEDNLIGTKNEGWRLSVLLALPDLSPKPFRGVAEWMDRAGGVRAAN